MIDQAVVGATGLRRAVEAARQRARALGHPVLLSRTDRLPTIDPAELFARGARLGPERAYWERPDQGASLVGLGAAWAFESGPSGRFRAAARAWTGLVADAELDQADQAGPLLLGGFAFDPSGPTTDLWRGFPAA
ncbi:MAG TPA: isochorismate synthase, partial [Chloroflexota bacterium]